jgi:hypothetical protein
MVIGLVGLQQAPAMAANADGDQRRGRPVARRPVPRRPPPVVVRRQVVPRAWRNYDYRRFEPGYRYYDASRYYRSWDSRYYQRTRLGRNDRIYRGYDDRYYCRRGDGTTGLIVGGITGSVLGGSIGRGDSKPLAALLGLSAGALIGRAIDRNNVICE